MSFNGTQGNEKVSTNLRQADSIIKVEGLLSEKDLSVVVVDGKKAIRGSLTIQTSDIIFVVFNVYINELTKNNTINQAYKGIETVMNTYRSVAEVGVDQATRVRVTKGQIAPETYFDANGQHDVVKYKSNFFNRIDSDSYNPHANFEMEIFITAIKDEVYTSGDNRGELTGRVIVEGYLPTYNGIEPMTLIGPTDLGVADGIRSMYVPGQTAKFYGDVNNSRVVVKKEIPVVIGKPRTETKTVFKNELIITGAEAPYPDEMGYNQDSIKAALNAREEVLAAKKVKAEQQPTASVNRPVMGMGVNPAMQSQPTMPKRTLNW